MAASRSPGEYDCADLALAAIEEGFRARDGRFTIGAWAACEACAALVEAGDQPRVTQRAVEAQAGRATTPPDAQQREELRAMIEPIHRAFFSLRQRAAELTRTG